MYNYISICITVIKLDSRLVRCVTFSLIILIVRHTTLFSVKICACFLIPLLSKLRIITITRAIKLLISLGDY